MAGLIISGVLAVISASRFVFVVGSGFASATTVALVWTYWPAIRLRVFPQWRRQVEAVAGAVRHVIQEDYNAFQNLRQVGQGGEFLLENALRGLRAQLRFCKINGHDKAWELCERFDYVLQLYFRGDEAPLREERVSIVNRLRRWLVWIERELLLKRTPTEDLLAPMGSE